MKPQVVLSLFDGMSCGQIALNRLGIPIKTYYASELDPYPIKITQTNYPDTIQLGDVCDVKAADLPKIDILLAGSPCQGFSFAGKQLAFDDPRSMLFFQFVRLLKECKPKYFLLENVKMKKEYLNVITELVGVKPVFINSALLSAQNRQRWYWTNIPGIEQPEDKKIVLRDILEHGYDSERDKSHCLDANYYKGSSVENYFKKSRRQMVYQDDTSNLPEKSSVIKSNYYKSSKANFENDKRKGGKFSATGIPQTTHDTPKQVGVAADINGHDILKRVYSEDGKSPTCSGGNREPKVIAGAWRGRSLDKDGKNVDWKSTKPKQMLELRKDEKSNALSQVTKDNVIVQSYREVRTEEAKRTRREIKQKTGKDHTPFRAKELVPREDGKVGTLTTGLNKDHTISFRKKDIGIYQLPRGTNKGGMRAKDGKVPSMTSSSWQYNNLLTKDKVYWRKLTPRECESLQTVPDNYTAHVSNSRRYQCLGNGWTVDVICHILKNMQIIEEGGTVAPTKGQETFDF